jgi:hypothetical protein
MAPPVFGSCTTWTAWSTFRFSTRLPIIIVIQPTNAFHGVRKNMWTPFVAPRLPEI